MTDILDTAVFVREYNEHSPQLLGYLIRQADGNADEGHDLLQETAMRAWKAKADFKGNSSVKSWFYTIGINLIREKFRRKKLLYFTDKLPDIPAEQSSPVQNILQNDLRDCIAEEVAALPPQQREIFMLIRYEGLSYKEAAEKLGTTVATIRMRLHHANTRLVERLQAYKDNVL